MKSKVMLSVLMLTCMALCLNTVPAKAQMWELVTDASTLKAGDVLVIASNSKGTTTGDISSQIMASIASTFSDDKSSITTLGEGTVELTLGGTSGAWTLANNEGKLLGATAVKKLAWGSGTTTWSITISNDNATIQNGTSTYGRFLYNATSGQERFTTYTSDATISMLLPQLYRKTGSSGGVTYTDYLTECAAASEYTVNNNLFGLESDAENPTKVAADATDLTLTYSAADGYLLPTSTDNITVKVGNTTLTTKELVWSANEKALYFEPKAGFTGDVVVTIYGILKAPTNVVVSEITANSATITWTKNSSATDYIITYLGGEDIIEKRTGNVNTYTLTGLTPNTEYACTIKAIDSNTPKTNSAEVNAHFTTISAATYTITWNANGTTYTTTQVTEGNAVVLPAAAPASCSYTYTHFVGWFTEVAGTDGSPSATTLGTQVTAETVPTRDATYYAVFSDEQLSGELTLATSIVNGDKIYLATTSGTGISGANSNNKDATVSTDKAAWMPFIVTNYADGTFQLKNGTSYVSCAASVFTLAAIGTSLTLNENGYFTFTIGKDTFCLMQNYSNSTNYYRCYKTTNINASNYTQFFMYKAGNPATGYISSCCTDAAVVTITPASSTVNIGADGNATTTVSCSQEGGGTGKWTYSVSPSDGATFDGTTFTATKAGTYTLTATYTENCGKSATTTITVIDNPIYTVTWSVDGTPTDTRQYNSGEALVLPETTPSGCGDKVKVFVGWTANSAYDDATTAPSDLFTEAKGTVTANANYYAVFAKKVTVDTQVKSKTLEITIDNFKEITTSYTKIYTQAYADHNTSVEAYGVYKNKNGIQMNSGKGTYIKNTLALAAPITNITCNWTASGKNSPTLYVASDMVASTSSDNLGEQSNSVTTQSVDVNPNGNYRYFYFDGTTVTGACYLTSLQITYGGSYSTYSEYTTSCSGRASMPAFTPASGATIQSGEKVVITCSTDGAAIHYTLDGSEPTAESALYTGDGVRISVQEAGSVTLKAIAIADGMGTSYVATATYSVTLPAPTGVVLHANNDTDDYAAVSVVYGSSEPVCYFPTYADSIFLGFYTSATKGEGSELYAADGTMVLNVEGYTDAYGWASLDSRIDLYAQWMKPEAIVVDENTTNLDKYPYDLSKMDIIITSTGTLTITKDVTVHDVHVQSGGSLVINGGTLGVNSLHLYSGWQGDKTTYGVASVYIAPEASLSKTVQTVYLDLCIDNDHFYPLAVPFPVKICGTSESEANMQGYHVRYAEDWLNQYAKYRADGTGQVIIKRYDGAHRAETGKAEGNWVGVAYNETLQPSEGYIIRAVPVNGQDTAVIRIEMEVPDAWTTGGEQGTVEKITRNQISVTAHGTDKPALDDTHKGWNMLGVPYLSYFGTQHWDGESSGIAGGKVVIQDGKIVLDDKKVRYVSVPTYDFSEYIQTRLSSTSLRPGWSFFVQIGKGGTLTFATTDREASSPLLAPAQSNSEQELTLLLSHGTKSDHTGLILSDAYTTDYEIGADLEKMFGEGFTLSVYTLIGNTRLAYNALSRESATQLIPVGFRAPEDGEYTFSLPEDSPTEGIERIDLIDYETGTLTNLLSAPYTFSTTRTESESRFAITITYSKETPTDTEAPFGKGNKRIEKVLIQQQLYIIIDGKIYDATGKKVNE